MVGLSGRMEGYVWKDGKTLERMVRLSRKDGRTWIEGW